MKRPCPEYNTLSAYLRPLIPDATRPQADNLALFIYGLILAQQVHLPRIALLLPVNGNTRNAVQRLERFLKNKAVAPTAWYKGVARAILACWKGREIEFWIEETFRDFKEQGFRLDKTPLQAGKRVEALLLCVCIAYTWTLLYGVELEQAGKRHLIDRAKKPQLSVFQFALRYLKRLFARRQEFPRQFRLSTPKYEG